MGHSRTRATPNSGLPQTGLERVAGRKKRRSKLSAEQAIAGEQASQHQARLQAALARIRERGEQESDDEVLDEQEIRSAIASPEGEMPLLWRTGFIRCADPDSLSEGVIVDACHRGHGIVSVIGRILGVSNGTLYSWINKRRYVKSAIAEARESMVDLAECRLFEAVNRGEDWAVREVLHCLGTHRGWLENKERPNNRGEILDAIDRMVEGEPAD